MSRSVVGLTFLICTAAFLVGCSFTTPPKSAGDGKAVTQKSIERITPVSHVPMVVKRNKFYVKAHAEGVQGDFIFDTGSPTIFSAQFAQKIGLKPVGRNRGVDANGTTLAMDIAIVERLALGDTVFHNVPVLIHDFSGLDLGSCLIGDGVLGSELLPGSVWRIDQAKSRISIAASATALGVGSRATRQKLYDTGYPHLPIIDYRVGDVAEKALFDTGNSERVVLFKSVANAIGRQHAIMPNTTMIGTGYQGESAGGLGQIEELARFTLKDFEIGTYHLGQTRGTTRAHPPTLVGAGILSDHVVTLDYPGEQFILEKQGKPSNVKQEAGYAISYRAGKAEAVQLFQGSNAARAGLQLGDEVLAINGRRLALSKSGNNCDQMEWVIDQFDPRQAAQLNILRAGQRKAISVPGL